MACSPSPDDSDLVKAMRAGQQPIIPAQRYLRRRRRNHRDDIGPALGTTQTEVALSFLQDWPTRTRHLQHPCIIGPEHRWRYRGLGAGDL
jgi:hypothetical protein